MERHATSVMMRLWQESITRSPSRLREESEMARQRLERIYRLLSLPVATVGFGLDGQFRHLTNATGPSSALDRGASSSTRAQMCTICLETPDTFGLLLNCDHCFCLGMSFAAACELSNS